MVVMRLNLKQRAGWTAHVFKACTQQHHTELLPVLRTLIPADGIVVDVGAHGGQFAKLFGKLANRGRVYAFEPSPYALSILRPAVRWSGLSNVEIVEAGLSDTPGELVLTTPIKRRGDLGFGLAHFGDDGDGREAVSHRAPVMRLDDFAADRGLERLDFLKADVEGWELSVLRGALETIRRFRPALLLEINPQHLKRDGRTAEEFWRLLEPLGYRAERLGGDYLWRA